MSIGFGILKSWLFYGIFFTAKSTLVVYSKASDSITIINSFLLGRKEIKMMRISNLVNVYPIEVMDIYSISPVKGKGISINLLFKNGEIVTFFTPDQQNFIQLVDDIDKFCLNNTASRDMYVN